MFTGKIILERKSDRLVVYLDLRVQIWNQLKSAEYYYIHVYYNFQFNPPKLNPKIKVILQ